MQRIPDQHSSHRVAAALALILRMSGGHATDIRGAYACLDFPNC
jgi:hypothetical protein